MIIIKRNMRSQRQWPVRWIKQDDAL